MEHQPQRRGRPAARKHGSESSVDCSLLLRGRIASLSRLGLERLHLGRLSLPRGQRQRLGVARITAGGSEGSDRGGDELNVAFRSAYGGGGGAGPPVSRP